MNRTSQKVLKSDIGKTQKSETKKVQTKRIKKYHALDLYISFSFVCIIIYTVVHTIIFYKTGIEATVLDALFYGVFGGEVLLCALLKRLKLKLEHDTAVKNITPQEEEVELNDSRYEM